MLCRLSEIFESNLPQFSRIKQLETAKVFVTENGVELVRRCRAGNGAAWEEIVQIYSRRIFNLAYRFTSNAEAAEDLTQEVFIRIYRSLEQNRVI